MTSTLRSKSFIVIFTTSAILSLAFIKYATMPSVPTSSSSDLNNNVKTIRVHTVKTETDNIEKEINNVIESVIENIGDNDNDVNNNDNETENEIENIMNDNNNDNNHEVSVEINVLSSTPASKTTSSSIITSFDNSDNSDTLEDNEDIDNFHDNTSKMELRFSTSLSKSKSSFPSTSSSSPSSSPSSLSLSLSLSSAPSPSPSLSSSSPSPPSSPLSSSSAAAAATTKVCLLYDRTLQKYHSSFQDDSLFTYRVDKERRFLIRAENTKFISVRDALQSLNSLPTCSPNQVHGETWPNLPFVPKEITDRVTKLTHYFYPEELEFLANQKTPHRFPQSEWQKFYENSKLADEGGAFIECNSTQISSCKELETKDLTLSSCNFDTIRWYTPGCQHKQYSWSERTLPAENSKLQSCLTSKTLLFIGDSTLRTIWERLMNKVGYFYKFKSTKFSGEKLYYPQQSKNAFLYFRYHPGKTNTGAIVSDPHVHKERLGPYVQRAVRILYEGRKSDPPGDQFGGRSQKTIEDDLSDFKIPHTPAVLHQPTTFVIFGLYARANYIPIIRQHLCHSYMKVYREAFKKKGTEDFSSFAKWSWTPSLSTLNGGAFSWEKTNSRELSAICEQSLESTTPAPLPSHVQVIIKSPGPLKMVTFLFSTLINSNFLRETAKKFQFQHFDALPPSLLFWSLALQHDCGCHFHDWVPQDSQISPNQVESTTPMKIYGPVNEMWLNTVLEYVCQA